MNDTPRSRISHPAFLSMNMPKTYVPDMLRQPLMDYINFGKNPGSLLTAILNNDLYTAQRESRTSEAHIFSIVRWLDAHAPAICWKSEANQLGWSDARRRDQLKAA